MMARFIGFNLIRYLNLGFFSGIIAWIVSGIITYFHIPTYTIKSGWISITAATVDVPLRTAVQMKGYYPKIGNAIIDFLQGKLGLSLINFVGLILGSILVILVGRIIYGFLFQKESKGMAKTRVLWSLLLGHSAFGLLVIPFLFGMDFLPTFLSMVIYGLVIGIIMQILVGMKGISWINE